MADDNSLKLDYQRIGNNGKLRLMARLNGEAVLTDKLDMADAKARAGFARKLCQGRKGIGKKTVAAELERIAGEVVAQPGEGDGKADGTPRRSQADILVQLAEEVDLFHTPGGQDSEGYAALPAGNHRETWPIASKGFKHWLSRLYYLDLKKAPSSQALQDATNVLAGQAIHDGAERPVAVRLAEHQGAIYLDLADPSWRAVSITTAGWQIVDNPPVRFCRRRGMLPLPAPTDGGQVDELRGLVNVPDDDAWYLLIGWMVAALRPGRPFPVLVVNGEQGSAKSTLCRMVRAIIDPNEAPLRRPPLDDRDLMIAASNSWIIAFDNLSGLSTDLSDALCSLTTHGSFSTRELYSDGEEKLFSAMRPVIVNGIEELATRSDLLDRSITLTLPVIDDDNRQEEDDLWQRFAVAQPRVLGALLDAVSVALANKGKVQLASKPRMADFAAWVVAAEPALSWPADKFLAAYLDNRTAANSQALEESVLAPLVIGLLNDRDGWQGTATELLAELESRAADSAKKKRTWPTGPRKLSGDLRRLAPNLRKVGIEVLWVREPTKRRSRHITIARLDRTCKTPSTSSTSSEPPENCGVNAGRYGRADRPPVSTPSDDGRGNSAISDDWTVPDGSDGVLHPQSGGDLEEEVEWTA